MSEPENIGKTEGRVIPPWLGRFVDVIENVMFLGRLERLWQGLIDHAQLAPGEKVMDVGCGSGQVAVWAAEKVTGRGEVVGIDASERMVELSRERAKKAGADVRFHRAAMEKLPFEDGLFDVVLSSQALHHVPREAKVQGLSEMRRILKSKGRLLILDHGKPYFLPLKVLFYPFRWNIIEFQAENVRGEIPGMIAGVFGNCEEVDRFLGWMRIWRAVKS